MQRILLLMAILLVGACASAKSVNDDLDPWPAAEAGETRYVIRLPTMQNESIYRVEIEIGKEMKIDCNERWFGGKFERQVVSGWGYPLYRLTGAAGSASTMMACPKDRKRTAFVAVRLDDPFLRYNSKLPVVVYVPDGFRVRYRVWSTDENSRAAQVE